MSAICGVVGLDGRPWKASDLDGVLDALARLGPDGRATWAGPVGRCGVALGAALRRATPEDAADGQPALAGDGSLVLVGDLRLDNRTDLAARLGVAERPGVPDSALVLRAYERWGETAVDHLVGEFALAIADRRRGGVFLARDVMGVRPLVVHRRPGVVAFASVPPALAELEGVGHRLDEHHVAEVIALASSSPRTFVAGVEWVPPGTSLWVDATGVRARTWWTPDPEGIVDLGSRAAHERELRDAFDAAVAGRLRSAGRVGATVSGGLDSTSAAASAAMMLAPEPLLTFTSAPPPGWHGSERRGWEADESPLVHDLAAMHPNIVPTFVHVALDSDLLTLQEPLWEAGAGPGLNPCNMLWMLAIRRTAAEAGVTSMLTGDFGNLFFSADAHRWMVTHLRAGRLRTAAREANAWRRASGTSWSRILRHDLLSQVAPPSALRVARRLTGRPSPLDRWLAGTALRREVAAGLDLHTLLPQTDEAVKRDTRTVALSMIRHQSGHADVTAAMAAITGVESRDPTSDRRVLEVAIRQPEWVRRYDGVSRAVVRGAMADRLPKSIVERTRRGEQLPEWLDIVTAGRAGIAAEVDEVARHPLMREVVDVERLRDLVGRWPERGSRGDEQVIADYRLALLRAVVVARYVRWFEGRSAHREPTRKTGPIRSG